MQKKNRSGVGEVNVRPKKVCNMGINNLLLIAIVRTASGTHQCQQLRGEQQHHIMCVCNEERTSIEEEFISYIPILNKLIIPIRAHTTRTHDLYDTNILFLLLFPGWILCVYVSL